MKLKYYLFIIVLSLIFGFGLAFIFRLDFLGLGSEIVVKVTNDRGCPIGSVSRFSSGFPFSVYKDCEYKTLGAYCTRRGCETVNYGNISVLFNGFFWSILAYIILRIVFRKKLG